MMEEKQKEREEAERRAELRGQTRTSVKAISQLPKAKNFVETSGVTKLPNTVQLWSDNLTGGEKP